MGSLMSHDQIDLHQVSADRDQEYNVDHKEKLLVGKRQALRAREFTTMLISGGRRVSEIELNRKERLCTCW